MPQAKETGALLQSGMVERKRGHADLLLELAFGLTGWPMPDANSCGNRFGSRRLRRHRRPHRVTGWDRLSVAERCGTINPGASVLSMLCQSGQARWSALRSEADSPTSRALVLKRYAVVETSNATGVACSPSILAGSQIVVAFVREWPEELTPSPLQLVRKHTWERSARVRTNDWIKSQRQLREVLGPDPYRPLHRLIEAYSQLRFAGLDETVWHEVVASMNYVERLAHDRSPEALDAWGNIRARLLGAIRASGDAVAIEAADPTGEPTNASASPPQVSLLEPPMS